MFPDNDGKPGQAKTPEVSSFVCPSCGKPLAHRVKEGAGGYNFWGCSGYKEGCKKSFKNAGNAPNIEGTK